MSLYYLFSKTNFLIPTVSCVRHIFVGAQSTFLKLTDTINYNLCDLRQLISNAYSESGTLCLLLLRRYLENRQLNKFYLWQNKVIGVINIY